MLSNVNLRYLNLPTKWIEDKEDFFRSGIKEASKIRNLLSTCQRIFVTNSQNVYLYLVGEADIYRIDILGVKKQPISHLYYLPKEYRLDIYDMNDPSMPMFMWKNKKCIMNNMPKLLEAVRVETLFLPLVSVI